MKNAGRFPGGFGGIMLVRWRGADGSLIGPADFIPIAEDSGSIVSLGEWVLDEALRQVAEWQREHAFAVAVAVNISPAQLGLQRPPPNPRTPPSFAP